MKKILSLLACATIATTVATEANAEEVRVKEGDTLWSISNDYNVSVDLLKQWNDLETDTIKVDDTLHINIEQTHNVQPGDTLWSIASENDISVADLKNWNGLIEDTIYPNEELIISKGTKKDNSGNTNSDAIAQQSEAKEDPSTNKKESTTNGSSEAKEITVSATAYTADCEGCSGITATGINLKDNPNKKVIAVDPNVIPLGSQVYVEGYGTAIAGDTGGAIKGNKIDLHVPTTEEALNWGRKEVTIKIIE